MCAHHEVLEQVYCRFNRIDDRTIAHWVGEKDLHGLMECQWPAHKRNYVNNSHRRTRMGPTCSEAARLTSSVSRFEYIYLYRMAWQIKAKYSAAVEKIVFFFECLHCVIFRRWGVYCSGQCTYRCKNCTQFSSAQTKIPSFNLKLPCFLCESKTK